MIIATLAHHTNNVNAIELSRDELYLFSAGDDMRISLWYTDNWNLLCEVFLDFSIYSLQMSNDSQFLMCKSKDEKNVCFYALEENNEAIRLNFSIKNVQECYVSANEEDLVVYQMKKEIEVWNLKSKVREKLITHGDHDFNTITVSYKPGFIYV